MSLVCRSFYSGLPLRRTSWIGFRPLVINWRPFNIACIIGTAQRWHGNIVKIKGVYKIGRNRRHYTTFSITQRGILEVLNYSHNAPTLAVPAECVGFVGCVATLVVTILTLFYFAGHELVLCIPLEHKCLKCIKELLPTNTDIKPCAVFCKHSLAYCTLCLMIKRIHTCMHIPLLAFMLQ